VLGPRRRGAAGSGERHDFGVTLVMPGFTMGRIPGALPHIGATRAMTLARFVAGVFLSERFVNRGFHAKGEQHGRDIFDPAHERDARRRLRRRRGRAGSHSILRDGVYPCRVRTVAPWTPTARAATAPDPDVAAGRLLAGERAGWARGRSGVHRVARPSSGATDTEASSRCLPLEGIEVIGWREVPIDAETLGDRAKATQAGHRAGTLLKPIGVTRRGRTPLCAGRKRAEKPVPRWESGSTSRLSFSTITYKGIACENWRTLLDLTDERYQVPLAIFHQRFSTTRCRPGADTGRMLSTTARSTPSRARQPDAAREGRLGRSTCSRRNSSRPVIDTAGSDSAMLDTSWSCSPGGPDVRPLPRC